MAVEDVQDTAMYIAGVPAISENVVEATATSVTWARVMPGSSTMILSKSPNAVFQTSQSRGRSRYMSPILCCGRSPVGLFVVQRRTQLAEWTTASAMSGVGQVAAQM